MALTYTYWQDHADGLWVGYWNDYPEHMTQGHTLDELRHMLQSLRTDIREMIADGTMPATSLNVGTMEFA